MHYVQHFKINGVDTKQVACIELQGKPNAATEGCVGLLAIDVTSPLHEVYKCITKNGNIHTWELLSSGTCIMSSTITGAGEEIAEFPYDKLKTVANYVVKVGDVIIDKEGFLYQVESINYTSCMARYNGTQIVSGMPKVGQVDNGKILSVVDGCHAFVNVEGSSVDTFVNQKQMEIAPYFLVEPNENGEYELELGKVYKIFTTLSVEPPNGYNDQTPYYDFLLEFYYKGITNQGKTEEKRTEVFNTATVNSVARPYYQGSNWFTLKPISGAIRSYANPGMKLTPRYLLNGEEYSANIATTGYLEAGSLESKFIISGVTKVLVENDEAYMGSIPSAEGVSF